jgi:hypothetical protein
MKKFSILEAQSRLYGGGNPFSNGHRSKSSGGFLENRHVLLDLDYIIYDDKSILVIVENKYKAESRLGNILEIDTYQKRLLIELSNKLACDFVVHITSENRYYNLTSGKPVEIGDPREKLNPNIYSYESDDVLYIEFRNNQPVALVKRSDGIKVNNLLNIIANKLNIKVIGVNDSSNSIKFYEYVNNSAQFIGEVFNTKDRSQLSQSDILKVESEWIQIYKKMGLY